MQPTYNFSAELWVYEGDAPWYFVTLPVDVAEEIKMIAPQRRGFGSLRVKATIGQTSWNTSIFPDSQSKSYVLPIKKDIRAKNNLTAGDKTKVTLMLLDV